MGEINWKRVFVIGLMLGSVQWGLQLFNMMLFAADAVAELGAMLREPGSIGDWHILLTMAMYAFVGIATVWLYAEIRPRYGPGPRTAAIAGFVMFLVIFSAHVQWATAVPEFTTGALVVTGLVSVPVYVGSTTVFLSAYKEAEESSAPASPGAAATEPTEG